MWHFLAETTQQGATQGLNGRSTIRLPTTDGTRIISPARPQPHPRPAHQTASGTSYVSAHSGPKHLDRKAAPAQPAFRTPGISHIATRPQAAHRRHARQVASRIPNSMSAKPPMPLPPGLSHFPEKAAALFHVEGKTRERQRVRNASPAGKGDQLYEVKG